MPRILSPWYQADFRHLDFEMTLAHELPPFATLTEAPPPVPVSIPAPPPESKETQILPLPVDLEPPKMVYSPPPLSPTDSKRMPLVKEPSQTRSEKANRLSLNFLRRPAADPPSDDRANGVHDHGGGGGGGGGGDGGEDDAVSGQRHGRSRSKSTTGRSVVTMTGVVVMERMRQLGPALQVAIARSEDEA